MSTRTAGPETAAARVHREIRDRIADGTHPGGAMLSENALATDLGVSRTPVRAALLRLAEEGWVTIYPQRGALVRTFTRQDAQELAAARHVLETGGVRAASPAAREALCVRLDALADAQEAAARGGDGDAFVEASLAFHRALVGAAGNALLLELGDRLQGRQGLVLRRGLATAAGSDADVVQEHRAMVEALRRRDVEAFSWLLAEHVGVAPQPGLGR